MYRNFNANPKANRGDDCTVRAISKVMNRAWEDVYIELCIEGLLSADMPSANHVWGAYLQKNGFHRYAIPNTCPNCYTLSEFASDHKEGRYIVALQNHVVAVIDGDYYDTWNSGDEVPLYYWKED